MDKLQHDPDPSGSKSEHLGGQLFVEKSWRMFEGSMLTFLKFSSST